MSKGTVLVVDDDAGIVEVLTVALEWEGYRVVTALGQDVLRVASSMPLDLILLDIMMPGIDGVELSRRLRENPASAHVPIVAMSALHNLEATAAAMPVDGQLPKPFHMTDLYEIVARWAKAA